MCDIIAAVLGCFVSVVLLYGRRPRIEICFGVLTGLNLHFWIWRKLTIGAYCVIGVDGGLASIVITALVQEYILYRCAICSGVSISAYKCSLYVQTCFTLQKLISFRYKSYCCYQCLRDWIAVTRDNPYGPTSVNGEIGCFNGCGCVITISQLVRDLPTKHRQMINEYADQMTLSTLRKSQNTIWCPCGTVYDGSANGIQRGNMISCVVKCVGCQQNLCIGCGEIVSPPARTRRFFASQRDEHRCSKTATPRNTKKCTRCGALVVKIDGCNHVRCTMWQFSV